MQQAIPSSDWLSTTAETPYGKAESAAKQAGQANPSWLPL
jgi:hypothetical protein